MQILWCHLLDENIIKNRPRYGNTRDGKALDDTKALSKHIVSS